MDQRTRKLMAMHKALHPRDDVDRLYVPRKEGGQRICQHRHIDTTTRRLHRKTRKRTDYGHQKQYWFGLVSLFNGISTFVGYLIYFPKGICPKVNVIARLEFELAYYDSAVYRFNHCTTRTPPETILITG